MQNYDASRPLYFHHIPKTAGTSVTAMLRERLGPALCPALHWDTLVTLARDDVRQYRAFSGHFSAYLPRYLGYDVSAFTVLRDPVERTISHYAHIARAEGHPFHRYTKSLSLRQFIQDPKMSHNVRNYQARYIADFGLDPNAIARNYPELNVVDYPMQMYIDEYSLDVSNDRVRSAALSALDGFFLVGVVEDFDAVIDALSRITGMPLGAAARINVAPKPSKTDTLDAETLDAIREVTAIDQELYDLVRARGAVDAGTA